MECGTETTTGSGHRVPNLPGELRRIRSSPPRRVVGGGGVFVPSGDVITAPEPGGPLLISFMTQLHLHGPAVRGAARRGASRSGSRTSTGAISNGRAPRRGYGGPGQKEDARESPDGHRELLVRLLWRRKRGARGSLKEEETTSDPIDRRRPPRTARSRPRDPTSRPVPHARSSVEELPVHGFRKTEGGVRGGKRLVDVEATASARARGRYASDEGAGPAVVCSAPRARPPTTTGPRPTAPRPTPFSLRLGSSGRARCPGRLPPVRDTARTNRRQGRRSSWNYGGVSSGRRGTPRGGFARHRRVTTPPLPEQAGRGRRQLPTRTLARSGEAVKTGGRARREAWGC